MSGATAVNDGVAEEERTISRSSRRRLRSPPSLASSRRRLPKARRPPYGFTMNEDDLERARAKWIHRGSRRPPWAIPPGPGQESVWDYPRPPRLEPDLRLVRVLHEGTVIAESRRSVRVLETAGPPVFYLPPDDVRTELLSHGTGGSHCEWKGGATYWSLCLDTGEVLNVGWSYERPYPEFAAIGGYLSFYPARLECYVGDQRVQPQPGGFYGGWITPEIVGPFKGEESTSDW